MKIAACLSFAMPGPVRKIAKRIEPKAHAIPQPDAAIFGELHRIAARLMRPVANARHRRIENGRNIRGDRRCNLQPLALRARREQFHHALDERRDLKRCAGDLELAASMREKSSTSSINDVSALPDARIISR